MANRKRKGNRSNQARNQRKSQASGTAQRSFFAFLKPIWRVLSSGVGLLAGLVGIFSVVISFVYYASPSVSVEPTDLLEAADSPDQSLVIPFYIKNDGNFPIVDVEAICVYNYVETGNFTGYDIVESASESVETIVAHRSIHRGCQDNMAAGFTSTLPIEKIDVSLLLSYNPRWWPGGRKSEGFHFLAFRKSDGQLRWLIEEPVGLDEPALRKKWGSDLIPTTR